MTREDTDGLSAPSAAEADDITQPCLTVLRGGPIGLLYTLPVETATLIGRGRDVDIRLTNRHASRRHARIIISAEGTVILEDLDSTNGTFLNGTPIKRHRLVDGDKFHIGPSAILKFSYRDAVERSFYQELVDSEIKDAITGAYSRTYVLDQLSIECTYAERHGTALAILLFEVDHLAKINDMYGSPAGNFAVKTIARLAGRTLRGNDVLARYAASRFVVLARDTADAGALMLAQRIRWAVSSRKIVFQGVRIPAWVWRPFPRRSTHPRRLWASPSDTCVGPAPAGATASAAMQQGPSPIGAC